MHLPRFAERGGEFDPASEILLQRPSEDGAKVVGIGTQTREPEALIRGPKMILGPFCELQKPVSMVAAQ